MTIKRKLSKMEGAAATITSSPCYLRYCSYLREPEVIDKESTRAQTINQQTWPNFLYPSDDFLDGSEPVEERKQTG